MSHDLVTLTEIDAAANYIREKIKHEPQVGLILGSGLGSLVEAIESADVIPFVDIPHFPISTVPGHSGRLVVGQLEGHAILAMQGRAHYYEGYSMSRVTLPIRIMQRLGIRVLIVTNAAGGLNPNFQAGDLMLITDHINLIGMAGLNPLRGPNLDEFGPRFPDMSVAYDRQLCQMARQAAAEANMTLQEGVYICLAGPSFETPADLKFLRLIGADAVGMSTVPEVTVARHGGVRVLGISGISNMAVFDPGQTQETNHEEVLDAGRLIVPKLTAVIRGVLGRLPLGSS